MLVVQLGEASLCSQMPFRPGARPPPPPLCQQGPGQDAFIFKPENNAWPAQPPAADRARGWAGSHVFWASTPHLQTGAKGKQPALPRGVCFSSPPWSPSCPFRPLPGWDKAAHHRLNEAHLLCSGPTGPVPGVVSGPRTPGPSDSLTLQPTGSQDQAEQRAPSGRLPSAQRP